MFWACARGHGRIMGKARDFDIRRIEVIDDKTAEFFRSLGGVGRLELMGKLNRAGREYMAANVRRQHPDWNDDRVRREVARRVLDGIDLPGSPGTTAEWDMIKKRLGMP